MIPQVPPGHLPSVLHCPCMHACMHACRSLTRAITRTHTQTQPAREEERVSFYFIKSRLQRRRAASTCGGRSKKEGAMRRRARPARESSRSVRRMVVAVTVPLRPSVVTQTRSSDTALSSKPQLRSQAGPNAPNDNSAKIVVSLRLTDGSRGQSGEGYLSNRLTRIPRAAGEVL